MKAFQLIPAIAEYEDFKTYAQEAGLGAEDLILTNIFTSRQFPHWIWAAIPCFRKSTAWASRPT